MTVIPAKNIRNLIATLVIISAGIRILLYVPSLFVDVAQAGDIGSTFNDMGNLIMYGALGLAIILVPFYLSARSNEKREKR